MHAEADEVLWEAKEELGEEYQDFRSSFSKSPLIFTAKKTSNLRRFLVRRTKINGVEEASQLFWEICLMRHLGGHENLHEIESVVYSPRAVYLFTKEFHTNMENIIFGQNQLLTDHHVQFFLYNILRGLKFLHSANLVHGNIQPGSILSNANDDHVIADLGTASIAGMPLSSTSPLRFQAPEQLLGERTSKLEMDMWSVGCVLAEMLLQEPVFQAGDANIDPVETEIALGEEDAERMMAFAMGLHARLGSDSPVRVLMDLVHPILELTVGPSAHCKAVLQCQLSVLGTPSEEELASLGPLAKRVFAELAPVPGEGFNDLFANANPAGLDLLRRMLAFDPSKRPTAVEALDHLYLDEMHDPTDNPSFEKEVDLAAEYAACFSSSLGEVQTKLKAISAEYAQRQE
eukprot:CAMPEP_0181300946 /NCGR_PEP_ID=MMETSP1101-20121128/7162_1 /TAXON_ID=46948 /ORGANISM="Rhodomonas abbreviata, Strain Caron Lab Isolate" /LENGTH=402 /DNA_ID=CAMNT_0023406219 /DNA_START=94 /DNA_END=1302 /DNA_ORIENTATION=-